MFPGLAALRRKKSHSAQLLVLVVSTMLGGCRSAYVEASIENRTGQPVNLIEVDYPEASFGTQSLAPHASYPYRFKIQGSGQVAITFTGTDGKAHTEKGPMLREGQEGKLQIHIDPGDHVNWSERLIQAH